MDANSLMAKFFFFGRVGWGGGRVCWARDQFKQQVTEGVHWFQWQMLFTIMYKQNNHS